MSALAWSYQFNCVLAPAEILAMFNATGPWEWSHREGHWYADYLNCRPSGTSRVRIHDRRQHFFGSDKLEPGPRYKCQLETTSTSDHERSTIDVVFREMLAALPVTDLKKIDSYD
jgi:hypothetical protein